MTTMTTRDRILAAAWELFEAGGLEAISMRAVAARVGVTAMALYRHFADKQALIEALVLDSLLVWAERVGAIAETEPRAFLARLDHVFLDFALKEPRRFEAAFLLPSQTARQFPDDFAAGRSPAGRIIVPMLRRALDADGIAAPSALEAWIDSWALGQGLVTLYRAGRFAGGEAQFRAHYHRAMARLARSLRPEKTS